MTLSAESETSQRLLLAIAELEKRPPESENLIALAEACFRLAVIPATDLDESARYLRKAIRADAFHPKLHYHLGRILWLLGDFPGAVRSFIEAVRLAPSSQRAYAHLALAVREGDEVEKEIARAMLEALAQGNDAGLLEQRTALEQLYKEREKSDGKPKQPQRRKTKEHQVEGNGSAPRWKGARLLSVVELLSRIAPDDRRFSRAMSALVKAPDGAQAVTQACLLLLTEPEAHEPVRTLCKEHALAGDTPLGRMLQKGLALQDISDTTSFIREASAAVVDGDLPLMWVGLTHFHRFGPASPLKASEALRVLESYPAELQTDPFFIELRIAVLNGYARASYIGGKYAQAHFLWSAARELDPNRVDLAHNIALVTTRWRASEDYEHSWQQAIELRYLRAAGLQDLAYGQEDRIAIHKSFARQSALRHLEEAKPVHAQDQHYSKWLADHEALHTWIESWDLYYLNSRLAFRSPIHRLGIARDASPSEVAAAAAALNRMIDVNLSRQPWLGIQAFSELARLCVQQAAELACDDLERGRDPYQDAEHASSSALTEEMFDRSLAQAKLLQAVSSLSEEKELEEDDLRLGGSLARSILSLPLPILKKLWYSKGVIQNEAGFDRVVFPVIVDILIPRRNGKCPPSGITVLRDSLVQELIPLLPDTVLIRFKRVNLLSALDQFKPAYDLAVETIPMVAVDSIESSSHTDPERGDADLDNKTRQMIRKQLVVGVDNFAFGSLAEPVLAIIKAGPKTRDELDIVVTALEKACQQFPCAGQIALLLGNLLIQAGDEGSLQKAVLVLEEGKERVFEDESKEKIIEQLTRARAELLNAAPRAEIKSLAEGAVRSVKSAIETRKVQTIRAALEQGIADVRRAARMADQIADLDLKMQASKILEDLQANLNQVSSLS